MTNTAFCDIFERRFEDTFHNRLGRFVQQVSEGCKPEDVEGSGADGLAAQKVLAAAIESVKTESVVQVL